MTFALKLYAAIRRDLIVLALCPSFWNLITWDEPEGDGKLGPNIKKGVRRLFEAADAIEARLAQEATDWG